MSKTVDERVVSMQFDNKHFETNVKTTMSTLDKLKQALNLKGASKGFEEIGSAAGKVDMHGLGNSVETVRAKFSALQVMGVTALANITNSAVNAGKRIVSALTIDPIKTGFNEYELKMDSIKTIVASTGEELKVVNKYLEELNEYSDQTIYSFSDMTQNIGKFTNAGVKLEDAVLAIKGISNEAAVSGANANEASRAMYNFAQALSTGYIQRIDWKSIELANMATLEFKNYLLETAEAAGTVTKNSEGLYTALGDDKAYNAAQMFTEALDEQWLTSEVLIDTLKQYSDPTTEIGKKAFAAAQDVTKLSQMFDVLKETAQSGWAKTWEIIFGDLEQAKAVFSPLTKFFGSIIEKMDDFRNAILESALGRGFGALADNIRSILKPASEAMDVIKETTKTVADFGDIVDRVIRGEFGNAWEFDENGMDRYAKLTKLGYNYCEVQNKVNEALDCSVRFTEEEIEAQNKLLGIQSQTTESTNDAAASVEALTEEQVENIATLAELSEAELRALGYTEEQIAAFKELKSMADKLGISVKDLLANIDNMTGRSILIDSFKNIGSVLVSVFKAIGDAWKEIFTGFNAENIGNILFDIIAAFHKFSVQLKENTGDAENIKRTFKGVFAILDIILTLVGGPLKIAFKVISKILGMFNLNLWDVTAVVGDVIVKFRDWIDASLDFTKIFEKIAGPIKIAIDAFRGWISVLKEAYATGGAKGLAEALFGSLESIAKSIKTWFSNLGNNISNGLSSIPNYLNTSFIGGLWNGIKKVGEVIKEFGKIVLGKLNEFLSSRGMTPITDDMIAGFVNGIKDGAKNVWNQMVEFAKGIISKVKEVLGIHSPSTVFFAIGGFIIAGLLGGLSAAFPQVREFLANAGNNIADAFSGFDFSKLFAVLASGGMILGITKLGSALENLTSPLAGVGDVLSGVGTVLMKSARSISKVIKASAKVVNNFAISIKKIGKAIAGNINAKSFMAVAKAILMLVGALVVLALIPIKDLIKAVVVLGIVAGTIFALTKALAKTKKGAIDTALFTGLVMSMAGAMLILAIAAKMFAGMTWEGLAKAGVALVVIGGLAVGMMAATKLVAKTEKGNMSTGLEHMGKMLTQIAGSMLILAVAAKVFASMSWEDLGKAGAAMVVLAGIMVGLMAATQLIAKTDKGNISTGIEKMGNTIMKIAVSMIVLAVAAKIFASMSWEDLGKAGAALLVLAGMMVGLTAATKLVGKGQNVGEIGKMMLSIAGALLVLAIVAKIIAGMTWEDIGKAGAGILGLSAIITGLIAATRLAGGNDISKLGGVLMSIAGVMFVLTLVAKIIAGMSWEDMGKAGVGLVALGGIITGLIAATRLAAGNDLKGVSTTLILISVAMAILAGIAVVLSLIDPAGLGRGIAAVGALSLMMALLISATRGAQDVKGNLISLTVAIAVLAGSVALLSMIEPASLVLATGCISGLMGMFALLIKTSKSASKSIGSLIVMTVAIGVLGGLLYLLAGLPIENVVGSAIALSTLILTMSGALIILSVVGKMGKEALKGVLALTAMAVPLLAFVGILALMQNIQVVHTNVLLLVGMATALTLLLIPLTIVGAFAPAALMGVLALTAMAVPLLAFVGILALMQNIQNATANTMLIIAMMDTLSDVIVKVSLVAPLALIAVGALTALTGLIAAIGVMAVAIGALMTTFPQLEQFLNTGLPILEQLAGSLGTMIGKFIAGFATEIMNTLPQLGLCLSQFMINATPFIMGAKLIDEKVLAGVGILAGAVLALTAVDLIAGVASFIQGGSSFADLGTQLSQFMLNATPFIAGAAMLNEDMMNGIKALADTILVLTAANVIEGLASFLTGGSSLENFAAQLPILGNGLRDFSANLGTFTDEQVATVVCAADAIKTLAQASSEIPNTGGLLGQIVGENDLGVFAAQFPILGSGLRDFLTNVGTFTDAEVATVNCAAQAIKSLAEASSQIPNSGGWLGQIVGENDLGTFAAQFPILGSGLRDFLTNVGTFSDEQVATVDSAAQAIKTLAEASSQIPNTGGWLGQIVGNNDLGTFAAQFPNVGSGIRGLLTELGTFTPAEQNAVTCAANSVKTLAAVAQSIPNTGGLLAGLVGDNDLGTFASSFPQVGAGIKGFTDELGTFNNAKVDTVNAGVNAVRAIASLAATDLSALTKNLDEFSFEVSNLGKNVAKFCENLPGKAALTEATSQLNILIAAIKNVSNVNSGALSTFATNLQKVGKSAVEKFIGAFTSTASMTDVSTAAKKLANKAVSGAESKATGKDSMESAGKDLGDGLVKGIDAKKQAAYNAGYALGQEAVRGEKDGQNSNSPSKDTEKAGKWLGEGLIIGMKKIGGSVYDAGKSMGHTAVNSMSNIISEIADIVAADLESQPTIRPILDLSDVAAGANSIGSMFSSPKLAMANIGAISSISASRQNGVGNGDLLSAIKDLGGRLGNTGNTYSINGINVTEGTEAADAIQTLVRVIKMEGRS